MIKNFNSIPSMYIENIQNPTLIQIEQVKNKLLEQLVDNDGSFLDLDTRRKRCSSLLGQLNFIKKSSTDAGVINECNQLRVNIKQIMLENWAKQVLVSGSRTIDSNHLKTEIYENTDPNSNIPFLEPRDYTGINPYVDYDFNDLSMVTAFTPSGYTQAWHHHHQTHEITFYTGKSVASFMRNSKKIDIETDKGDIVIFDPKTSHTITNISNKPIRNISIKMPTALVDRSEGKDYNQEGFGRKVTLQEENEGVYSFVVDFLSIPYKISMIEFTEFKEKHTISISKNALIYVVNGQHIISGASEELETLRTSDVVIGLPGDEFVITKINQNKNSMIYKVEKI